jgi:hypothetical protein
MRIYEFTKSLEDILRRLDRIEDILNRPYEPYEYPGDNKPQPEIDLSKDELK